MTTIERDPAAVAKHLSAPDLGAASGGLARTAGGPSTPFDPAAIEAALRSLADERGIKAGALIHATRVLVTGQAVSPGLFEVLALVGRDRVLRDGWMPSRYATGREPATSR